MLCSTSETAGSQKSMYSSHKAVLFIIFLQVCVCVCVCVRTLLCSYTVIQSIIDNVKLLQVYFIIHVFINIEHSFF